MEQNKIPEIQRVTEDYPGFVVHDDRVSGSITFGHSRLPLWCVISEIVEAGYSAALESYPELSERASADEIGRFLHDLLESRKNFARLLCVLADVERQEREARWNEHGPNAVYLYGADSQLRNEIAPALADIGLAPTVEVDPQNLPPGLKPWYSHPESVRRVREVLLDCLDSLDRMVAEWGSDPGRVCR